MRDLSSNDVKSHKPDTASAVQSSTDTCRHVYRQHRQERSISADCQGVNVTCRRPAQQDTCLPVVDQSPARNCSSDDVVSRHFVRSVTRHRQTTSNHVLAKHNHFPMGYSKI